MIWPRNSWVGIVLHFLVPDLMQESKSRHAPHLLDGVACLTSATSLSKCRPCKAEIGTACSASCTRLQGRREEI
eukprot:3059589-Amphidinium_carterae.1